MDITSPPGATLVEPDDLQYLIPNLSNRQQVNEFEQDNIFQAEEWAHKSRKLRQELLSIESLILLHRNMFNNTWRWAGQFRTRQTNIGVEPHQIRQQLATLCDDGKYWLENSTYELEECAVRVHHRLAKIHPFVNGNGRHARLIADLMMLYARQPQLSWGGHKPLDLKTRQKYLTALQKADNGSFDELIKFATARQ